MVTRKGVNCFTIIVLTFAAGFAAAQAVVAGPQQDFIPNPPDDEPETTTKDNGPNLPIADAVYRVEKSESGEIESGQGEVQSELVRWHGGWGWRHGWGGGWGGGWGYRWGGGWGYPGWGWGRPWALGPVYRPYYGAYFGYPALGFGYPVYANRFAYGGPYGFGGYGMPYPWYPSYGFGIGYW
jgi:hypothetical protein